MASHDLIDSYLSELKGRLGERVGDRVRVLAEVEEHLRSTATELHAGGLDLVDAQRHAIERFGAPRDLAPLFVRLDRDRFRTRVAVGILGVVWATVGLFIALSALESVNADARPFVAAASVVFPLAAFGAAFAASRNCLRLAGALLLVSVATPTYFAFALNLLPLVIGMLLVSGALPRRPSFGWRHAEVVGS